MIYEGRPGRRVNSIEEVWDGEGGVYFLNPHADEDGHRSLWFRVPESRVEGVHRSIASPCRIDDTWDITENEDGTVTASPSIALQEGDGQGGFRNVWHGYLEGGKWRSVE